jgi:aconitase B
MSDDKVRTGITETAALSTMFMAEAMVKHNYNSAINSKTAKNIAEKASNNKILKPALEFLEKHKLKGKVGTVLKGLIFVSASMTAYSVGQKVGESVADNVEGGKKIPKKINQKA